jgi:hypothetical protein
MNAAHYDPELPFLEELERQVRDRAEHEARARPANPRAARMSARGPSAPGTRAARMTRRTAILVALLCLIAATALGTRAAFFNAHLQSPVVNHQGAFVAVASGRDGGDRWTLRLYIRNGQLCRALVISAQAEASGCAPTPAGGTIDVTSLQSAQHSYLFGVDGSRVRAIRVHAGSSTLTVESRPVAGERAHAAGLPSSARYFLAVLERPRGGKDGPAVLTALDAARRRIGGPRLICLAEAGPPPCGP